MIQENISLKPYNTFGIEVHAREFERFNSPEVLKELLVQHKHKDLLILGGGSNILFTKDFEGTVLKNEIKGTAIIDRTTTEVFVKVGAGEVWHDFVMHCVAQNWGGIENLSLIPGTVGASPMQNIGAYGVEIKDVFHSLEAIEIESGTLHTFSNAECKFGYRESIFKNTHKGKYVIVSVTFKLSLIGHQLKTGYGAIQEELDTKGIIEPTIKDVSDAVIAIRSSKLPDPKKIGNAGSFFKNPVVDRSVFEAISKQYDNIPNYPASDGKVKLAAGWLIEKAGWKGYREHDYGVHEKQALVLVNYDQASGSEVFSLSEKIINDISNKFNIKLEREVNIL